MVRRHLSRGLVALCAGVSTGCFRAGPPDHFYMLRAAEPASSAETPVNGPRVGLGPVRIPSHLDRPQIMTAVSAQEYRLSDEHRWAERLDENIARVTARNLSSFIPTDRIAMYPWSRDGRPDLQITLTIQDMHVNERGEALMRALWTLRDGDRVVRDSRFECHRPASTSDYARMVEAHSVCLERLNRLMAEAVRGPR